jgi:hypothetical protein
MKQPEDQIQFMIDFLNNHHGKRLSVNANERMELQFLRKDVEVLKNQLE